MTPQELFDSHRPLATKVALYLWRQVRLPARPLVQAEDLEAVALEALWRAALRWEEGRRGAGTFAGWAWRIAVRRCVDYLREVAGLRRKFRARALSIDAPDVFGRRTRAEEVSDGTFESARAAEQSSLLAERALRRVLDPRGRALLKLCFCEGLKQKEAAAEVGVSESWASLLIRDALAQARGHEARRRAVRP
jgi:RNA polymerase sigma factor (sigma-70 family)